MGGNNSVSQKFEDIEGSFAGTFESQTERFKSDVFALVINSNNPSKLQGKEQFGSKTIPNLGEGDVRNPERATAKVEVKDANGNPIDANAPTGNAYVELYSKKNVQVAFNENKDYRDLKAAVDDYARDLQALVGGAAAGGPLAAVSSVLNSQTVENIRTVMKTTLNLASVSSGVGITQITDTTFVPGGVYVCNLIYSAKAELRTAFGTEIVSMSIFYTIVATSTDLINSMKSQESIGTQFNFLSKLSLDVVAKQGELLGWSDFYPKTITLAASGNKIKCGKTAATMDAELAAMPWRSTQEPDSGRYDLKQIDDYARALSDYKNYGRYKGYLNAKEFLASLIDDVETDSEVKDLLKGLKTAVNELKTNTQEDNDRFFKSYTDLLDNLRPLLG